MDKVIEVHFFRSPTSGIQPTREWIHSLPLSDRQKIGRALHSIEYGWPIGMPLCRPLGDGLFEVRVNLDKRIARVLFCIIRREMWVLHGFIKTTQKLPPSDLHIARQRKGELSRRKP